MPTRLVLLRHGESQWNLENRFTGWTDVGLSPRGKREAKAAGRLLAKEGYDFDLTFTSYLKRAILTSMWPSRPWIASGCGSAALAAQRAALRALQGLNKAETAPATGTSRWRSGAAPTTSRPRR